MNNSTSSSETQAQDTVEKSAPQREVDHSRIAELIKTQYSGLLSLVRRKLKDRELASDLVNEAITITLEHARLGRLTHPENAGGYVFKVSMNLLRNHQRSFDNRQDIRSDADALSSIALYDIDDIESAQIRRKTLRLIDSLASPRDREVVRRFYLEEEDKQVICNALGLTPLQFTQVISRARQRMKLEFESQGLKQADFFSMALLGIALMQLDTTAQIYPKPATFSSVATHTHMQSDLGT